MKPLVYNRPRDVQVKNMPDRRIERPTDVLAHITRTKLCGSDLHIYEGRADMKPGRILGHENAGGVMENFETHKDGCTKVTLTPNG